MLSKCPYHPENTLDSSMGLVCQACEAKLPPTAEWWKKNVKLSEKAVKRPLIEFTRTKKIEKHLAAIGKDLGRIATALEIILQEAYGYQSQVPTVDTSGPEPQVGYTDQDEYDINEIVDEMGER